MIGGGTHQLKGIELYHDCPIFYCLGNFIFENQYVRLLPADYMEKYGLNISMTRMVYFVPVPDSVLTLFS